MINDVVKIPPAAEPVAVSWIKKHTQIPTAVTGHDDILRDQYMMAGRETVESDTGRLFCQQTRILYLDRFPRAISIPRSPVRSLVSLKYLDQSNVERTFSLDNLVIDQSGEWFRLALADDALWPVTDDAPGAVRVEYRAGYAAPFTVDASTDVITAPAHDLTDGDCVRPVTFGGTLPAGLSTRNYFVINAATDTLQLSNSPGGSAIDITDAGAGDLFLIDPAGYSVYSRMTLALALATATWFENRQAINVGNITSSLPMNYDDIVAGLSRVMF